MSDSTQPSRTARLPARQRSGNVRWEDGRLDRRARWELLGHRGATVWITGLPAAGKSTIGRMLEERLVRDGRPAFWLDGDNLRHGLNGDLGFTAADRAENVRRTAHAARLLAEAGTIAIVSLISPYAADRRLAREIHERDELPFIEVFVDTPLRECERCDPKGLYARARAGTLTGLTGVDDPYEAPDAPDVHLDLDQRSEAIDIILPVLRSAGVA